MLKKLKLSGKLITGFLISSLITLLLGTVSWFFISDLSFHLKETYSSVIPTLNNLYIIKEGIMDIKSSVRTLMIADIEKRHIANQLKYIQRGIKRYKAGVTAYENLPHSKKETALWQELTPYLATMEEKSRYFNQLATAYSNNYSRKIYAQIRDMGSNEFADIIRKCRSTVEKLISINNELINELAIETEKDTGNSLLMQILGVIFSVVTALGIAFFLNKIITKPIIESVTHLNSSASQVASASEELASTNQQLAEGNSEQAASIQQTSSTLEETASMALQNSKNTKEAAELSAQTKIASEKGNAQMQEMLGSMNEIKKSSDQIAKIIKVIDEIAFQTNILALNAAVEAARAGEAGMGFAVVAEEVRNLAQRSAQAAKDTTEIIENNIDLSKNGLLISEKVGESLAEITDQAQKVNALLEEVASASQEQSQGIFQINKAMSQMEQVTQRNASGAEESAAAAEEMSSQAMIMQKTVQELLKLVYGVSQKPQHSNNYSEMTKSLNNLTKNNQHSNLLPNNTNHTVMINPDEIIPLENDQGDF